MKAPSPTGSLSFVLVEDNELDREKIERSLRRLGIDRPLVTARDGVEALELLRGTPDREPLRRPYVLLIDLNMPRMGGLELLREIRADASLGDVPAVVLTTSDRPADVDAAYQLHVAAYLVKPVDRGQLVETLGHLDGLWRHSLHPSGRGRGA